MDKWLKPKCPKCGSDHIARIDLVTAYARVGRVDLEGNVEWDHAGLLVDWDTREPINGTIGFEVFCCCECGIEGAIEDFVPSPHDED